MKSGLIIVNKGTRDDSICIKWVKKQYPDMSILSVSLEGDPYVDLNNIYKITEEEGIEHYVIPFKPSFISSKNQNIEKAWEFERQLKGVQRQRSILMHSNPTDIQYEYILSTLRNTEFNNKCLSLVEHTVEKDIWLKQYAEMIQRVVVSVFVRPLASISTEEELDIFISLNNIEMSV